MAKAVGHESGAPRELAIGPGRNLILYKDGLFFCHEVIFLLSFHVLRWIPLDDPISFHIAVATLVAANSFVHVLTSSCRLEFSAEVSLEGGNGGMEEWW